MALSTAKAGVSVHAVVVDSLMIVRHVLAMESCRPNSVRVMYDECFNECESVRPVQFRSSSSLERCFAFCTDQSSRTVSMSCVMSAYVDARILSMWHLVLHHTFNGLDFALKHLTCVTTK